MAARPVKKNTESFQFGPWTLTATKSHILQSEGPEREKFESHLELPQLPEMVFAENILRLQHSAGYGMEFNALDALRPVDAHRDLFKVAVSQVWKESRGDCEHINDVVKPFDWTYTTDYSGTLLGQDPNTLQVTETTERIDLEKLKVQEKIHFYADIILFEDELADNGVSVLSVKIRVMPSSFFILMRQHMRIDNVLIRVNDTRVYHEAEKNYILREYTSRESPMNSLKLPPHILTNPVEVSPHLKLVVEKYEKLEFPSDSTPTS